MLLERVNSRVEVSVIDTGEGIAPEFLPDVFDRFQQGDASTTRRHGGLGLGLAIVNSLSSCMAAKVYVKSGGIGRGTTFTINLPLIAVRSEADKNVAIPGQRRGRTNLCQTCPSPMFTSW